jgi:molecular chaperone GrpE (heat shock protein)
MDYAHLPAKKSKSQTPNPAEPSAENERLLGLERDLQTVRLELEETKLLLNATRHDLDLLGRQSEESKAHDVRGQLERLFRALAGPATQLMAQNYMLNVRGRPLKAQDIQASCNRLLGILQNHGLEIQGTIDQTVHFDQDFHEPLALDEAVKHGDEVVIRMSGISYHGKVLRRAAVTKASMNEAVE